MHIEGWLGRMAAHRVRSKSVTERLGGRRFTQLDEVVRIGDDPIDLHPV